MDSETGKSYCGTCWQNWITCQLQNGSSNAIPETLKESPPTAKKTITESCDPKQVSSMEDDDSLGELEGVQFRGTLYLVSRTKGLVFDSQRSANGRLICVGETKRGINEKEELRLYEVNSVSIAPRFPFEATPEDHCETPLNAYEDIACYLTFLADCLHKDKRDIKIWDPYYCNGAVKRNLATLGFESVHNECEDFYQILKDNKPPAHDCIVTNPPYSTEPINHVHLLLKFLCRQQKPWFVVQPNYVYTKPFWEQFTSTMLTAPRPFFLTPSTPRRYKYQTPTGLREVSSNQHLKTSPFVSMWFCWLGPKHTEKFYHWIVTRRHDPQLPLFLACTEYFVPDSFKDSNDKTRRKPRKPKKRKGNPPSSSATNSVSALLDKKNQKRRRRS